MLTLEEKKDLTSKSKFTLYLKDFKNWVFFCLLTLGGKMSLRCPRVSSYVKFFYKMSRFMMGRRLFCYSPLTEIFQALAFNPLKMGQGML